MGRGTIHDATLARDLFDRHFENRWIGWTGPIAWPPRSPDLTPVVGRPKTHDISTAIGRRQRTQASNQRSLQESVDVCQLAIVEFDRRIRLCLEENEEHMEQLLYEKIFD